jgi:hypothetical protein
LRLQEASGLTGGQNGWNFEYNKYWEHHHHACLVRALPGYITTTQAGAMGMGLRAYDAYRLARSIRGGQLHRLPGLS